MRITMQRLLSAMMTLLLTGLVSAMMTALIAAPAHAQAFPYKFDSAASTNATLVVAGSVQVRVIVTINTTAALYYLKLYDKVSAPVCGTDPVVFKAAVPFGASSAGSGFVVPIPDGMQFQQGLGFCLTGGLADSDATVAATGVTINFAVKH
jgi:hypothetical protein